MAAPTRRMAPVLNRSDRFDDKIARRMRMKRYTCARSARPTMIRRSLGNRMPNSTADLSLRRGVRRTDGNELKSDGQACSRGGWGPSHGGPHTRCRRFYRRGGVMIGFRTEREADPSFDWAACVLDPCIVVHQNLDASKEKTDE